MEKCRYWFYLANDYRLNELTFVNNDSDINVDSKQY